MGIVIRGDRLFVPYRHRQGGLWMTGRETPDQQVFSFARQGGELLHFHVAEVRRLIVAFPERVERIEVELVPSQVEHVRRHNGVEAAHAASLSVERLREPGIMLSMGDGTDMVVDGNHRFVRRADLGFPTMEFFQVREPLWRLALLDIPDEIGRQLVEA